MFLKVVSIKTDDQGLTVTFASHKNNINKIINVTLFNL